MKTKNVIFAAAGIAALLTAVAAGYWAYPLRNPRPRMLIHSKIRDRAILSQARQQHFDIVILGDSIVELAAIQRLCGRETLNAGVGGATAADLADIAPEIVRAATPKRVVIAVGVNDASSANATTPAAFTTAYERIIDGLPPSQIILATVSRVAKSKPGAAPFNEAKISAFSAIIRSEAQRRHLVLVDLAEMPRTQSGQLPDDLTDDGVHLTVAGYRPWRGLIEAKACDG